MLVLRETTERPEAVDAGAAILVGTDTQRIYVEAKMLLYDNSSHIKMAKPVNPFGNGTASTQILNVLAEQL